MRTKDQYKRCAELLEAFSVLAEQSIDLMDATYKRFFQLCPEAEGLMGHSDAPMRGRMLEQTYELLMNAELDGPESYFRWEIANHLSAYGVSAQMYDTYFQALGEAMAQALGSRWDAQLANAWQARVENLLRDVHHAQNA